MAYMPINYGYPQYGYQSQFSPNQLGQNQFGQQLTQNQIPQTNIIPQQQIPTLYGKVVDGIDVVKSVDVPLGTTYIMPQASGNSVFSKGWNPDGTTFIKECKLVEQSTDMPDVAQINWNEKLDDIYDCIDSLSKKIDKFKTTSSTTASTPTKRRKQEVDEDE